MLQVTQYLLAFEFQLINTMAFNQVNMYAPYPHVIIILPCFTVVSFSTITWGVWGIPPYIIVINNNNNTVFDNVMVPSLPDLISCSAGPIENTDAVVSISLSRGFLGRFGVLSLSSYTHRKCKIWSLNSSSLLTSPFSFSYAASLHL